MVTGYSMSQNNSLKISAKDILVRTITSKVANEFVKKHHYSGKVVNNSQLHFGAFVNGVLHGVLSYGASMDKRKIQGLVKDTGFNEFLELNRMAFDEKLPKNSESRCIAITLKIIKKKAPHIKWIVSFADGTQCGDGTVYRASGFILTSIKKNSTIIRLADGSIGANMTYSKGKHILKDGGAKQPKGSERLGGFMLRYIYFIDRSYIDKLNVPIMPYSAIKDMGASMYLGERLQ